MVTLAHRELVRFFLSGLGKVSPAIATGELPTAAIYSIDDPLQCSGADVLWAGLEPGMLGIYQVDARLTGGPVQCEGVALPITATGF